MIPLVAHFIWIGSSLPYTHLIALRSAARSGGFSQVILHHTHDFTEGEVWLALKSEPKVVMRRLELEQRVRAVESRFGLLGRFQQLSQPAALANVVRAIILWEEGGVYLDLDTITIKSFAPLCQEASFFCGVERLVFPAAVRGSRSPFVHGQALFRTALRDGLRRLPSGWRWFKRVAGLYPVAANNAVMGAEAKHPFLEHLLANMAALSDVEWQRRFRLGTHLLQRSLGTYAGKDATVLLPEAFYPLGPEISEHWFRSQRPLALSEMLDDSTLSVHWYASVRTANYTRDITAESIRRDAGHQPYAALAEPFIE
ncbi:MAG: glycosyltransferase [Polyangiaceae bacterium]|nr:glycosyltransferase [Polyangiaceae bacterium]